MALALAPASLIEWIQFFRPTTLGRMAFSAGLLSISIRPSYKNGSGKSTLLHHIALKAPGLTISPKAKIGYFRQMSYQFTKDETVLEFLKNRSQYDEGFLRSVLHSMLFVSSDILKSVKSLSGGEAIRLQLCQLFLGEYNILLLDEPTSFL